MRRIIRRAWYLLRWRRLERDLAEEIETHRLMLAADIGAAASRRAMGNTTLAREDARAQWVTPWLDGVLQDAVYAVRMFRHAPAFTGAMVLVLALGIGAATGVFTLVDALMLRSLPVPAADRLVYFTSPSFSYPIYSEVRSRGPAVFSDLAAWSVEDMHVAWATELEPASVLTASGNFYSTLGITTTLGRALGPDDDRIGGGREGLVAVISHAAWQRRYGGDRSVIGRTLRVGPDTYTIVGVTPPKFLGVTPGLAPEITIPLTSNQDAESLRSPSSSWVHLLGRLRNGVTLAEANGALRSFWPLVLEATTNPGMPAERRALYLGRTTALESAHAGFSRVRNRFSEPLWLLSALVALLLTVACASAANLLLARGAGRRREIAVRMAIGAGRGRLIRQMLTESLIWTATATVVGLFVAWWGAASLVALMTTRDRPIVLELGVDWRVTLFLLALATITSAVCALLPALRATRLDPGSALRSTGPLTGGRLGRWSLAKTLVAAQAAVTVLLLAGAALFVRSLGGALSQEAGFDRERVLVLSTDVEAAGYDDERAVIFYQQLLDRLIHLPGVESASLSKYPPISDGDGAWTQSIAVDGEAVPATPGVSSVYFNTVSPDYFRTVGTRLLRGRDFSRADTAAAPRVVVVNELLARRFFTGQEALGRRLTIGRDKNRRDMLIVGVVSDAKYQRLQEQPRPIAYVPWLQHPEGNLFTELRVSGPGAPLADAARGEVRALDSSVPLRLETVADRIRQSLVTERVLAMLATVLAGAALTLACAALYGLLAYAVSRQTREIGLRLALGAERHAVLRLVMMESFVVAAIGVVAGLAAALAFGRFARGLLFQVTPADPLSMAAAAGIMLAVACLAGVVPAYRAARVDPVVALRCE